MSIKVVFDPVAMVIAAFEKISTIDVEVRFVSKLADGNAIGAYQLGSADPAIVFLSTEAPYHSIPETLAHELAHAMEPKDGHGERWEAAFDLLHAEYERIATEWEQAGGYDDPVKRDGE